MSRRGPHGLPSRLPGVPHRALRVRGDPERRRPRLHVLRRQDQPIAEREKMKATYPGFEFVYGDSEFTPDNHTPAGPGATALQAAHVWLCLVNAETDREDFCSAPFLRDHIWSNLPLRADGSLDRSSPYVVPYSAICSAARSLLYRPTGKQEAQKRIG